jgi:hypothetical protein
MKSRLIQMAALVVALSAASLTVQAQPVVDIERDLKCKPFDYAAGVDNAAKINAALAEVGKTIFDPIYIPGKQFAIADTLRFPARAGGKISTGGGRTYELGSDQLGKMIGSAATLVWTGPLDGTMIEFPGFGWVIEDLTLVGYPRNTGKDPNTDLPRCKYGLVIRDQTVPSGKSTFSMTFIGFDTAVCCSGTPKQDHCDNMIWPWFGVQNCRIAYQIEHCNSICHTFIHVWNAGCDVLFDAQEGGDIVTEHIAQNLPGTILRCGSVSPNAGYFDLRGIRTDNHARGFCLLECTAGPQAQINMSGYFNLLSVAPDQQLVKANGFPVDLRLDFYGPIPKELAEKYKR